MEFFQKTCFKESNNMADEKSRDYLQIFIKKWYFQSSHEIKNIYQGTLSKHHTEGKRFL